MRQSPRPCPIPHGEAQEEGREVRRAALRRLYGQIRPTLGALRRCLGYLTKAIARPVWCVGTDSRRYVRVEPRAIGLVRPQHVPQRLHVRGRLELDSVALRGGL